MLSIMFVYMCSDELEGEVNHLELEDAKGYLVFKEVRLVEMTSQNNPYF